MKIIFYTIFAVFIFACQKRKLLQTNYITLEYKQTQCADAWATATTDSLTVVNVASYLNTQQVYIAGLSIKLVNLPEVCNACICKTGKIIYVTTFDDIAMKQKYLTLGFQ